jgi:hypothetical protein
MRFFILYECLTMMHWSDASGKSMTLTAVLRSLPEFELVTLNFSSTTTPKLLLDTLSHYCKVERTPNGLVMHPVMQSKWLVICQFNDEMCSAEACSSTIISLTCVLDCSQ